MQNCVVYSSGECWIKGAKIRQENKEVADLALCFTDLTSTPYPPGHPGPLGSIPSVCPPTREVVRSLATPAGSSAALGGTLGTDADYDKPS